MDYYEELGISPNASEEEIRKAHRRLTKLFHPDQHTDEALKAVAETQMRRLNSIVDTLSDPERRQVYDEQLREGLIPFGPVPVNVRAQAARRRVQVLPWWVASTLAAILLTVGVVWFWANDWGSSFGNRTPTYIPSEATASLPASNPEPATGETSRVQVTPTTPGSMTAAPAATAPVTAAPAAAAPTVEVEKHENPFARLKDAVLAKRSESVAQKRAAQEAAEAAALKKDAEREMARNQVRPTNTAADPQPAHKSIRLENTNVAAHAPKMNLDLPPPPAVAAPPTGHIDTAAVPVGVPTLAGRPPEPAPAARTMAANNTPVATRPGHQNPLEGEWVYAPVEPEKKRPGFYPPEFIDLKLTQASTGLQGQYRARYNVADKPIPPDVAFTLFQDGANRFTWQSSTGSKGTLKVNSIDGNSIHVEWKTTTFSKGVQLTAGTATLVRRGE